MNLGTNSTAFELRGSYVLKDIQENLCVTGELDML